MKFVKISTLFLLLSALFFVNGCKDNSTSPSNSSENMTLVGQYNTPDYAYGISILQVNALYYALVADGVSGLLLINVTNPSSPTLISSFNTSGNALDVSSALINNNPYAFVSDGLGGLDIINISSPAVPMLDTVLSFPNDRVLTSFTDAANKNLYIGTYNGNMYVYNLANLPGQVNRLSAYATLDQILGIYVTGNIAYIAENSVGIEIVNMTNPSFPQFMSSYDTPGLASGVKVTNNYAYVADATSLYVINVSNPFSPVYAGFISTQGAAYYGVAVNYPSQVYTADYTYGVETFGIGIPSSPQQIGYYNTNGIAGNLAYSSGKIFVADGADGLIILSYP
jgi:hypothetical protein